MNTPIEKENIITPNKRPKTIINLSSSDTGWQSPKPIVDRVVNEKYSISVKLSISFLFFIP